MEDYEIQLVTKGHCPFCRHPSEELKNTEDSGEGSPTNDTGPPTPRSLSNEDATW